MITGIGEKTLPEQRFDEIEFYNYITRIIDKYEHSVVIFDLIDVFSSFGEVVPATIKRLVQEINTGHCIIKPSIQEQLIIYRKKGYSMREIKKIVGIHPNTQYRLLEEMRKNKKMIPTTVPRLDVETYHSIKAFMNEIKKFKEV